MTSEGGRQKGFVIGRIETLPANGKKLGGGEIHASRLLTCSVDVFKAVKKSNVTVGIRVAQCDGRKTRVGWWGVQNRNDKVWRGDVWGKKRKEKKGKKKKIRFSVTTGRADGYMYSRNLSQHQNKELK